MPVIPPFDPDLSAPEDVNTGGHADPAAFAAVGNALSSTGAQLQDTTMQFLNKYFAAQKATAAVNATADGFKQLDDAEEKWSLVPDRQKAKDGFDTDASQIGQNIVSQISNPEVRARVNDNLTMRALSGRAAVSERAFQLEGSNQVAALDDHMQMYGHQLSTAQNDVERASILDAAHGETQAMAAAGYLPPAAAEEKFLQMRGRADTAQADGDMATDPAMAAAKLKNPANYPYLDETRRQILLMRAEGKIQGDNVVLQGQVRQSFGDNLSAISSTGLPAVPLSEGQIRAAFPDQADQMLGELTRARGVYQAKTSTALTSPEEDQSLIEKWTPHGAGFADQQQDQSTIARTVSAKWQAIGRDPVGYVLGASPEVAGAFQAAQKDPTKLAPAVAALDAAYDKLKIPPEQRQVLPVDQANSLVSNILAQAPDQRAAAITTMAQTYGGLFPRVMGDLVRAKLPAQYELLAALPNSADRVALANGIGNGKKVVEDALPKGAASTITDGITGDPNYQDFTKSMSYGAGGVAKAGQLAEAAKLMAYGHVLNGANPADAARDAVSSFTTNKYDFWQNGDGVARVPKGQASQVESAADHVLQTLTPEQLSYPPGVAKNTGADPETLSRAAMLTVQKGKWVTNEQDNGLIRIDSNGYPVMLKNGARLELPFANVENILRSVPKAEPQPMEIFP